jgi:hypothetical protein
MAAVDAADVNFLGAVNNSADDAEVGAFNPAIGAASGDEKTVWLPFPSLSISPFPFFPYTPILNTNSIYLLST